LAVPADLERVRLRRERVAARDHAGRGVRGDVDTGDAVGQQSAR
jgi:hypothetical protein